MQRVRDRSAETDFVSSIRIESDTDKPSSFGDRAPPYRNKGRALDLLPRLFQDETHLTAAPSRRVPRLQPYAVDELASTAKI